MIPLIYIVVPVYNEASVIADVISDLNRCGYYHIIVVDDGSCDNTYMTGVYPNEPNNSQNMSK